MDYTASAVPLPVARELCLAMMRAMGDADVMAGYERWKREVRDAGKHADSAAQSSL